MLHLAQLGQGVCVYTYAFGAAGTRVYLPDLRVDRADSVCKYVVCGEQPHVINVNAWFISSFGV